MKSFITLTLLFMAISVIPQNAVFLLNEKKEIQIEIVVEELIEGCGVSAMYRVINNKKLPLLKLENLTFSNDYSVHERNSIAVDSKLEELGISNHIKLFTDVIKLDECGNRTVTTYISRNK